MSKHMGRSLTLQGAAALFIMYLLGRFGVQVEESMVMEFVETAIAFVGFIAIVVGRLRAKHSLHLKKS